ncbi:MAG: hypothetical protein WAW85_16880, partial [Gordonia sp. (in: high G+C Gram-positive bacteria)]|uniref:hypothetical protein n=1 Tax=Gordonia sp. (in: high G+C Gram-positive bacteria) TaxID=84139 RepID=UPI003BB5D211
RAADTRAADTRAADQTRLADAHAKLDRALAEVDRRDQLDPDRRIIEEAIRADQESVSTAVRNPMHHKRPSATADHHHDLDHNRGPDVGL